MSQFDLEKSIQKMKVEIKQLDQEIQQRRVTEKPSRLQGFPFLTPLLKAALLALMITLFYFHFIMN